MHRTRSAAQDTLSPPSPDTHFYCPDNRHQQPLPPQTHSTLCFLTDIKTKREELNCSHLACSSSMFLHLSVSHSVHRGGLCMMSLSVLLPRPMFFPGEGSVSCPMFLPGRVSVCGQMFLPGGGVCPVYPGLPNIDPPGQRSPGTETPPCTVKSGKYASYCNAFLLHWCLLLATCVVSKLRGALTLFRDQLAIYYVISLLQCH